MSDPTDDRKAGLRPRRATHRLRLLDRKTGRGSTIGGGWTNPDGHFTITLDVGVRLAWDDDVVITLWPKDHVEQRAVRAKRPTYDHTRADGPFDPCPICADLQSPEEREALARDRASEENT